MLNVHHLRTLAEVVRSGSFAAAAESLGYTASAVSQQMSALERAAGVVLFERGPHSVRPTAAAHRLAGRSVGLLSQLESVEGDARALAAGASGVIHLGSFPTAGASIVPAALARLLRRHPEVAVLLDEGEPDELLPALLSGAIDIAVVYQYPLVPRSWPAGLTAVPLQDDPLMIMISRVHPVAARVDWGLADLGDEQWIASKEGSAGSRNLVRLCADAGFDPRIAFRSNDYNVVRELVRAGLGVAIVPVLARGVNDGLELRQVLGPDAEPASRQVLALYRSDRRDPLVEPAVTALRQSARSRRR
ncbi:LysR family transcriptional regulator [Dactylosporangium sp. NPDC000521]|uniref:LysR family transcriptional regulator n=1 Tax=Dactylosporangium sp. NPDC000521 TaxID=3363975 RepID=UPI00369B82B2